MRGSYGAAAQSSLQKEKDKRRKCYQCDERKRELDEKNGIIITLHKKMETLRNDAMSQSLEIKSKEDRVQELIGRVAKGEYENVKRVETTIEDLRKQLALSEFELTKTKDEVLGYMDMTQGLREELEKCRGIMKTETEVTSKELKEKNKELVEHKLLHEQKAHELDEAKRTISNLNTMVGDLQYVTKALLANANANGNVIAADVEMKLRGCDIRRDYLGSPKKSVTGRLSPSKMSEYGRISPTKHFEKKKKDSEDESLGLAKRYLAFTKKSYALRQKAREKVKHIKKVDFVFADVNCNLCLKLRNGKFIHFATERELDEIIYTLERDSDSD